MVDPGPGILLIAEPFLKDPNFQRTVVLLCDHQEEGSFGFVINREFDHTLNELMNDMDQLRLPVYFGGPVQMDTIHFLHMYPDIISGSFEVINGIYWGGDFEAAVESLKDGTIQPDKIRFFPWIFRLVARTVEFGDQGEILVNSRSNPKAGFP